MNPAAERLRFAQTVDAHERMDECLLRDVFGIDVRAEQPPGETEDAAFVPAQELTKGAVFTSPNRCDELGVRDTPRIGSHIQLVPRHGREIKLVAVLTAVRRRCAGASTSVSRLFPCRVGGPISTSSSSGCIKLRTRQGTFLAARR
jgi:hypothetical protein